MFYVLFSADKSNQNLAFKQLFRRKNAILQFYEEIFG
jgi:hypothetical protein